MPIQRQIKINKNSNGIVTFDPADLNADTRDQIFWTNNDDKEPHWPGLREDGKINATFFMPNQIAPGDSSPIFSPFKAETFEYVCSIHPQTASEQGKITVA